MTDATIADPTARARKPRSRRAPARQRRRWLNLKRLRRGAVRPVTAEVALHLLLREGDLYRVGSQRYLVSGPITPNVLETLIVAAGATEDLEPETDLGIDDAGERAPDVDEGEAALGWANGGGQLHLSSHVNEDESSLGWSGPVIDRGVYNAVAAVAGFDQRELRAADDDAEGPEDDREPDCDMI